MDVSQLYLLLITLFFRIVLFAESVTSQQHDHSSWWGPYRPNLYFGMRSKSPNSPLLGLMWYKDQDLSHLRHSCEQDGELQYGWAFYDVRIGGQQILNDTANELDLTIDVHLSSSSAWTVEVSGTPRGNDTSWTIVWYIGLDAAEQPLECQIRSVLGGKSLLRYLCKGQAPKRGAFEMSLDVDESSMFLPEASRLDMIRVDPGTVWQARDHYERLAEDRLESSLEGLNNLAFIQSVFAGDFAIKIEFNNLTDAESVHQDPELTANTFTSPSEATYKPKSPFLDPAYSKFSKETLANLLGGIGYFYGTSIVDSTFSADHVEAGEEHGTYSLLTTVPSRPFFLRGFLWDTGFHLMVILDYDIDLALEIIFSWLDLMDDDGWIAREQILGPETRSKVPVEFQTQYTAYANPPTLFMAVEMIMDRLLCHVKYSGRPSSLSNSTEILGKLFTKLERHYNWFRRTQSGSLEGYQVFSASKNFIEGYRWRGQTDTHVLTSGLDDYPRASKPDNNDLHVDALCWVGLMAGVLKRLSSDNHTHPYDQHLEHIRTTLEQLHWSENNSAYCDISISPNNTP
ncbi:Mannosyl-oligosaccharide glucosidase [Pseudocercospora fuligena]|uniref:Mannosyl-oligosaccharide glucosidase n=1 Tax=Pseudocercospora fuligena TaxID=685502 RepID=A0A8H6RXR5_9PEZI|nr:Mannosyl-oligosaccharide glucosidase [Pseudocercospora fuligena]